MDDRGPPSCCEKPLQWRSVTDTIPVCYRHPDRTTRLRCASCGRPICPQCSIDTPVGQKCADCAKSTTRVVNGRAAVTTIPPATAVLLAINIGLFVVSSYLLPSLQSALDQYNPGVYGGEWWRLITGAFLHAGLLHIGFNMYALWLFGPQIERQVGSIPFAALYGSSLLWGAVAFLILVPGGAAVGASGAIFGLFGAWIAASYRIRNTPAGRRLWQQLIVLLGINLILGFVARNIAWQAHLGGLAAGVLIVILWQKLGRKSTPSARTFVAAGVGMIAVLAAVLAVLLG